MHVYHSIAFNMLLIEEVNDRWVCTDKVLVRHNTGKSTLNSVKEMLHDFSENKVERIWHYSASVHMANEYKEHLNTNYTASVNSNFDKQIQYVNHILACRKRYYLFGLLLQNDSRI